MGVKIKSLPVCVCRYMNVSFSEEHKVVKCTHANFFILLSKLVELHGELISLLSYCPCAAQTNLAEKNSVFVCEKLVQKLGQEIHFQD